MRLLVAAMFVIASALILSARLSKSCRYAAPATSRDNGQDHLQQRLHPAQGILHSAFADSALLPGLGGREMFHGAAGEFVNNNAPIAQPEELA
jgi:hypothetical protein